MSSLRFSIPVRHLQSFVIASLLSVTLLGTLIMPAFAQDAGVGGAHPTDSTTVPTGQPTDTTTAPADQAPATTTDTTSTSTATAPTSAPASDVATTASEVNLRSGPGTDYGILAILPEGTSLEVTGPGAQGWVSVNYNGNEGWISEEFVTVSAGTATSTDSATSADTAPTDTTTTTTDGSLPMDSANGDIVAIIYAAAAAYGQNGDDMLRVAQCESTLDPTAVNPSSGTSGLFQFMPSTWATTPYADQDIFDPVANANAAAWMWSVGRRGEWVCQ